MTGDELARKQQNELLDAGFTQEEFMQIIRFMALVVDPFSKLTIPVQKLISKWLTEKANLP